MLILTNYMLRLHLSFRRVGLDFSLDDPLVGFFDEDKALIVSTTHGYLTEQVMPDDITVESLAEHITLPGIEPNPFKTIEILESGGTRYYVSGEKYAQIKLDPKATDDESLFIQIDMDEGNRLHPTTNLRIDRIKCEPW